MNFKLVFLALSAMAGAASVQMCGGSSTTADAGDGGGSDGPLTDVHASDVASDTLVSDAGIDAPDVIIIPPPIGGKPPPPPDGGTPTSNVYTFALETIYLGDTARGTTTPSNTAWESFGYDVDGLTTTTSSTNVCTLYPGAPKLDQVDGTNGIDNSWGSNILPIVQSAASLPNPSQTETATIDIGTWTLLIQVTGLSDDPAQSAVGLTSQLFIGGQTTGTPAFDTTTDWPVLSTSVKDGTTIASGATVQFGSSYVNGGIFVTGAGSTPITLQLSFGGVALPITIHDPVLTFDHVSHASAAFGVISGVIDTAEFITTLQAVAGQISTSLCGSAFDGIAEQIDQAQEIMQDGTNGPGPSCNAISIGIGFDAALVANPTTVQTAPPPPPNPCGG